MIIDPWGQIVAEAKGQTPEVLEFKLSLEKVTSMRRQIPMKSHRRLNKPLV
jgi:predicted amidohydrolase